MILSQTLISDVGTPVHLMYVHVVMFCVYLFSNSHSVCTFALKNARLPLYLSFMGSITVSCNKLYA